MPSASASVRAVTATHAQGVELVAVTVAVASRDVRTSALVDLSWTVAHTARVIAAYAVVHIVADAIHVSVSCAVTATHAQGVELVAVTVAVASRDVRTSALVDLSWTVAHTARVVAAYAVVDVVADAIGVRVRRAVTATHAQGVELVAVTVAVASRDVRTSALVDLSWTVAHTARVVAAYAVVDVVADAIGVGVSCAVTATHAQGVELVAVTVAVASRDVRTSALVDLSWTIAHTARVIAAYAVVDIVADAIGVRVRRAVTATHAKGVELVAVTVAVASRDVRTSALVDLSWTVAIHRTRRSCLRSRRRRRRCHQRRCVRCAVTATHAQGVELVAVTVAVASRDVRTSALVDLTWTIAHTARVIAAYAVVHVVADAIGVGVRRAVTATHAQGVELVAVTVAVASRDVRTSALVDLSWTVAYTARVVAAYAVVDVVADAINVRVRRAVTATHAQGVELVAVTVAVASRDVRTSALVDLTWTVAHRTRRSCLRSRPRRRRCHRRPRPPCSHRHTRPRRRAGCRHSRSRQQGCQNIRTRKQHQVLHKFRMHRCLHMIRHLRSRRAIVAQRCNLCNLIPRVRHRDHCRRIIDAVSVTIEVFVRVNTISAHLLWHLNCSCKPHSSVQPGISNSSRRCRHCLSRSRMNHHSHRESSNIHKIRRHKRHQNHSCTHPRQCIQRKGKR